MSWDLCRRFWRVLPSFSAAFALRDPLFCALKPARVTPVIRRKQPIKAGPTYTTYK